VKLGIKGNQDECSARNLGRSSRLVLNGVQETREGERGGGFRQEKGQELPQGRSGRRRKKK